MNKIIIRKAERQDVSLLLEFIQGIARYEKMENEVVASPEVLEREMFDEYRAEAIFAAVDGREVGFALYFYNFSTFIGHSGLYIVPIHLFIIVLLGYFHFLAIHKQSMAVGFNM